MKAEVKWIDTSWKAFLPDGLVLSSAGIMEICNMVEEAMKLPEGHKWQWTATEKKLTCRAVEKKGKLSKSDE